MKTSKIIFITFFGVIGLFLLSLIIQTDPKNRGNRELQEMKREAFTLPSISHLIVHEGCNVRLTSGQADSIKIGYHKDLVLDHPVFSVSGDTPIAGIYELELGMPLKNFVDEFGDGDTKAIQVGGASGHCVPRKKFNDTIIGFEGIPTGGSMMIFNSSRSMYNVLHDYLEFFTEESCGQCTPCRVGCQQLLKGIEAVKKGERPPTYLDDLKKLTATMKIAAKCGLGQSVANPFTSIVDNFREEIIY